MSETAPQTWETVAKRLPKLMTQLTCSNFIVRDKQERLPVIPQKGIYVFYKYGNPVYVGRSDRMRERILEHGRPGAFHNSATFAFLLAMDWAKCAGIDCAGRSRHVLQFAEDFKPLYDQAKEKERNMEIKVVGVDDAIEQSVFEVYAALHLKTTRDSGGYNDFETH